MFRTGYTSAPRSGVVALALLPVLAACGDTRSAEAGGWTGSVVDSAGVTIVTTFDQGIWTDAEQWTVQEELRIGVESGDPELQFGLVGGIDVDDDGNIYVLDAQAARVRAFSPDGDLIHAYGRSGGGPMEFGDLTQQGPAPGLLRAADGNFLVPDLMNGRIARFTPEGEWLGGIPMDLTEGFPILWIAGEGGEIYRQTRRMTMPGMPAVEGGPTDLIARIAPDGTVAEELASFPSGETFSMGADGLPHFRFFSPEPVWTVTTDGRFVKGLNSEYSLHVRGEGGEGGTIIRRNFTRRTVTEGEQRSFRNAIVQAWEEAGLPQPVVQQMAGNITFEEHWPALFTIAAGPDGTVWVQRIDPSRLFEGESMMDFQNLQMGSAEWDVFGQDGRFLGVVELPEGFTPRRVRGDLIYGLHLDAMDVPRVMRLRIIRGEG